MGRDKCLSREFEVLAKGFVVQSTLTPLQRRLAVAATAFFWWFAGQRFGFFALGWIALAPFLWALQGLSARERWRFGWKAGWVCFALHNWWIVPTVAHAAPVIHAPPVAGFALGLVAVAFIAAVHGLQLAVAAWLWRPEILFYRRAPWLLPIVIAVVWGALDALRCETSMAHIWGALAFSQWRDTFLLQSVRVWGQHGLSAFCMWCAANCALWCSPFSFSQTPSENADEVSAASANIQNPRPKYFIVAPIVALIALHGWGAWRVATTPLATRHLRVLLVQTNVPSLNKTSGEGETPLAQALRLTSHALGNSAATAASGIIPENAFASQSEAAFNDAMRGQSTLGSGGAFQKSAIDIVVWPETTIRLRQRGAQLSDLDFQLRRLARQSGAAFLVGAETTETATTETATTETATTETGGGAPIKRNEAVLIAPDGTMQGRGKLRAVPFGERALFGDWLPFLKRFAPDPPIEPAREIAPISIPTKQGALRCGTVICFESCFPRPAQTLGESGIKVLWIITNDQWFEGTNAPFEHAAMGVLRAVENDVPVVQVANGGHSFVVDRRGRFVVKPAILSPDVASVPLDFGRAQTVEIEVPLD
jgi:apolipoprotein N-acyltransferase